MSLSFPNPSRSYDATLRAVRFWGHDGAMEASFFVNWEALTRIQPGMRTDEAGLLSAFDLHRALILATATNKRTTKVRIMRFILISSSMSFRAKRSCNAADGVREARLCISDLS